MHNATSKDELSHFTETSRPYNTTDYSDIGEKMTKIQLTLLILTIAMLMQQAASSCLYDRSQGVCCDQGKDTKMFGIVQRFTCLYFFPIWLKMWLIVRVPQFWHVLNQNMDIKIEDLSSGRICTTGSYCRSKYLLSCQCVPSPASRPQPFFFFRRSCELRCGGLCTP